MNTKLFVGNFTGKHGHQFSLEMLVDVDAIEKGQFKYSFAGDPYRLRDVSIEDYLKWVKSVLSTLSAETGKTILYAGKNKGIGIFITALPDGTFKERRKNI